MKEKYKVVEYDGRRKYKLKVIAKLDHCYYCDIMLTTGTQDHVKATSLGGVNKKRNKVPCCRDCNQLKKNLSLEEFRKLLVSKGIEARKEADKYMAMSRRVDKLL